MKYEFAHHLKTLREQRGMSQIELAQKAKVPASSISHFEAGKREPSLQNFFAICDALNTTADYFMGWNKKVMLDATALNQNEINTAKIFIQFLAMVRKYQNIEVVSYENNIK
ncbi:XRE family transcriptional regulator [Candidatus Dependentiae bacterium]|nr:MAG: XRE family transcriptional regulator [Candidatus Dependentiae bacterium]